MPRVPPYDRARAQLAESWRSRTFSMKALSFALVGVVNTVIDYGVFLLARAALSHSPAAFAAFNALAASCDCGSVATMSLIAANTMAWVVAVSASYVMNSSITFAAESGGRLTGRAYLAFVVSGIAGWIANTATLVVAAQVLLLPVWLAKVVAILASFVVNFSLSHFVVFRVRGEKR